MKIEERIAQRFEELHQASLKVQLKHIAGFGNFVESESWAKWSTSALNLLGLAFGTDSVHFIGFKKICDNWRDYPHDLEAARGVFSAAKEDYQEGFFVSLSKAISGELFGDFVQLAKRCLAEGSKEAAAVIACAALEDTLKRYVASKGIDVQNKTMQDVVNAMKSKGLITGAQKSLLEAMPSIRNYAMHADWNKLRPEDVNSVIGFVEQFLIQHF